ncbi:AAA family ATPase [Dactylosporangium sp. CA-139066]|uniref:AAA family ATPase n=1 Tax=Dactylosporangium sp. CA-139066 TaxID=3239930 RepID=UPI003D8B09C5
MRNALVGRDRELGAVREFVRRAAANGDALVLYGEAGAGKTVLLDAADETATDRGIAVVRTVGVEAQAELTYVGLHRLLLAFLPLLDGLAVPERQALATALGLEDGPPPERLAVSKAALSLLRLGAGDGSLLVVVDDLPWLDRMSAMVLAFVARRLAGTGIGFIGAFRTGETSFFDGGGLAALEVLPLDPGAAAALVDSRFPDLEPRRRGQVLDEAAGNPLALLELSALAGDPAGTSGDAPLSERLEHLFAARVRPLPAATRRVLLMAALDATGDVGVLVAAAGDSGVPEAADGAIDDLAPAEVAGLIRVDGERGRLLFRHPLMRSAVVAMSSAVQRRELHAALAARLRDQPDRRAWHLAAAADAPDESIAAQLEQAADRTLRRGDAVGAVAALLRACDFTPPGPERARRQARAAYVGAEITGDIASVPRLLADGGMALEAAAATTAYLLNGEGDVNAAYRMLFGALADLESLDGSDQALIEAVWFLIAICAFGNRAELWRPVEELLDRFSPPPPRYLTVVARTFGDPAHQALPVLKELDGMIARLSQEPDPAQVARLAIGAAYVDREQECRGPLLEVLEHGRAGGAVTSQIQAEVIVANDSYHSGQWDESLDQCAEGMRLCGEHGYVLIRWLYVHQDALIAAARGDWERAARAASAMVRWAAPRGVDLLVAYAHGIDALSALGRGDYRGAFAHASAITRPGELRPYVAYALWSALDMVEAAVHAGERAAAQRHVAVQRELNIASISPRRAILVAGMAGMAAPDGRFAGHFEEALAVDGAERWPFDLARIQLCYGRRLRQDQSVDDARRHLGTAFDIFRRLGANPWSALAEQELRALGKAPDRPRSGGLDLLTPQQREIAMLAATGLTNKQIGERLFLSPRTVSTHLYQTFRKLGVTSRAALRDALGETSQDPQK